jgi:high-affinity Fe2+/Pb2+ permease
MGSQPFLAQVLKIAAGASQVLFVAGLCLRGSVTPWRVALGVALVLAAGVFVRWTSGSYVGVQESGLIGVARLTVVATLAYGVLRLGLFRRGEHASIASSRSSLASQRV